MKRLTISVLLYVLCIFSAVSAEEPILVIDSQEHSEKISDVMFTPEGKTLVSVSEDKTIRIWDVETAELINTIRGQIGSGHDGKLFAGALSPDGKTLMAAGWLSYNNDYGYGRIRVFSLTTGEQIGLLEGHKGTIYSLAFSQDGSLLASGSYDTTVRIWQTPPLGSSSEKTEYRELAILEGHSDGIYGVAFSPDAKKLVSASYDGTLRLWELPEELSGFQNQKSLNYTEMKKHTAQVRCVTYAPDGKYIVSGGFDGKTLLWDSNGKFLKEIDQTANRVETVSFSPDSKIVFVGGGNYGKTFAIPSGREINDYSIQGNRYYYASAFHPTENVVAVGDANNQEIHIWDVSSGQAKTYIAGKQNMVWAIAFRKDSEGLNVAFGNSLTSTNDINRGALEKSFDFSEMLLSHDLPVESEFRRTRNEYQGKTLEKVSRYELRISGGGAISNEPNSDGWIESYAFTNDGDVIVGSSFSLKLYQPDGTFLREFAGHTGTVWAVSISEDGQVLASASGDQTIKLWNLNTGENLATLFVANDREWVCWTPQGYYTASAGGEKYIGWHLNQGVDKAAEFHPVSVFRKRFHHPELVKRTITDGKFEQALAEVNAESRQPITQQPVTQMLPPTVEWTSPTDHSTEASTPSLRIQANIHSENELTAVKILVNGRTQEPATGRGLAIGRQQPASLETIDQEITLTAGKNEIVIFAANENAGASSDKRIVVYRVPAEENLLTQNLYMVSIGISDYERNDLQLNVADDDAKAISRLFNSQKGILYKEVIITELYDQDATRGNIIDALEWLETEATHQDVAVIFIAAHGVNDKRGNFFILPVDADPEKIRRTAVDWGDFLLVLGNLSAKVLLLIDTCHSGQLGENLSILRRQIDNTEAIREMSSEENGVVILAASTGGEVSLEHPDWGHGAFTKALLEGLEQGQADYSQDGMIHLRELDLYVAERVAALTNNKQHPTTQKPSTISRFPIARVQ